MQFSSFQEFIQMGGYAFNVWSVYAMFVIFLAVNLLGPLRKNKRIIRELKRRYELNAPRPATASGENGAGTVASTESSDSLAASTAETIGESQ